MKEPEPEETKAPETEKPVTDAVTDTSTEALITDTESDGAENEASKKKLSPIWFALGGAAVLLIGAAAVILARKKK